MSAHVERHGELGRSRGLPHLACAYPVWDEQVGCDSREDRLVLEGFLSAREISVYAPDAERSG